MVDIWTFPVMGKSEIIAVLLTNHQLSKRITCFISHARSSAHVGSVESYFEALDVVLLSECWLATLRSS